MPFGIKEFLNSLGSEDTHDDNAARRYAEVHAARYQKTAELLEMVPEGQAALEIGATTFFQIFLAHERKFPEVWGTIFSPKIEDKLRDVTFCSAGFSSRNRVVSVDIESDFFPLSGPHFDLVMLCEVIEHLDVDPMFALAEINRITNLGGRLLLTTPNACSARNAHKCCLGYRPHFYMQYQKNRSPYRHNFEYDIHGLKSLIHAAGFEIEQLETHDVFEPTSQEAIEFLTKAGASLDFRGDDIFVLARKIGPITDRWPADVYA